MNAARGWRRWVREIAVLVVLVIVLCAARSSLADHYRVPSGSMEPTVMTGDRVLVNKTAYGLRVPFTDVVALGWSEPAAGDVVVLQSPDEADVTLLKRVVAGPGETIEVRDGRLMRDGRSVEVTWDDDGGALERLGAHAHPVQLGPDGGFGPVTVPAGRYLVLGDNRGNSRDGRIFGFVAADAILGRVVGVYWRDGQPVWRGL